MSPIEAAELSMAHTDPGKLKNHANLKYPRVYANIWLHMTPYD